MATKADELIDQIRANIERVRSLTEAENFEAGSELFNETEALIKQVKGSGSVKTRKELTEALAEAEQAKGGEVDKIHEGTVALETQDYSTVPGVKELISRGAKDLAEGVRLHLKAADT